MSPQESLNKLNHKSPRKLAAAAIDGVKKFNKSPEKPTHKLPRKVVAGTVGAIMLLGGVAGVKDSANHRASREVNQFTYKDLFDHYKDLGINPEDVTIQPVGEFETTAKQIAEHLYAKDPETVAQEIYVQLDGNIKPGEMIVIPNDQLEHGRLV